MKLLTLAEAASRLQSQKHEVLTALTKKANDTGTNLAYFSLDKGDYLVPEFVISSIEEQAETSFNELLSKDDLLAQKTTYLPLLAGATYVYFLFNEDRIVYVGQSTTLITRISSHSIDKSFDSVAYISVTKEEMNFVEMMYISKFLPALNKSVKRSTFLKHVLDKVNIGALEFGEF